jgi:alcohol dehydrogenase class IV
LDGIAWLTDLASDLNISPLSDYGLTPQDIPEIVEQSAGSSSMKGNPIDLPRETLVSILQEAL